MYETGVTGAAESRELRLATVVSEWEKDASGIETVSETKSESEKTDFLKQN